MKYKLIIFDLDGTILDTLDDLTTSTNVALEQNHYPVRTRDEVRSFVGNGIAKLISRAVPKGITEEAEEKVLKDFTEHYRDHCADQTKPYDGVVSLIQELRKQGYLTAVVSNKGDFAVQELCKKYFSDLFDFVVGEREHIRRKPAPDAVLEILQQLQVEKKDAIYIGDSEVDIQTAENAELDSISVTWGFRGQEFLLEQGAKKIVDSTEALLSIFTV